MNSSRCARLFACLCLLALAEHDPSHGYRFNTVENADNSDELFVVLTFSGGCSGRSKLDDRVS